MKERFRRISASEVKIESPNAISNEGSHEQHHTLRLLQTSVLRHEHFSSDEDDEFQIRRENGEVQGIFKVWASPIIPELEGTTIDAWSESLKLRPLALFESLEQWRSFCDLADRRLQQIFEDRSLPHDPEAAISELFQRLHLAFAFASPFYNLEALVADSRELRLDNPIDINRQETSSGKLDLAAMLLPSALKNLLIADKLDWGNISWDLLKTQVATLQQSFLERSDELGSKQFKLVIQVARAAGLQPEEVLFVTNALQFIPVSVGGKKDDLEQGESLAVLSHIFDQPPTGTSTSNVAQEMNALIRFLNWTTSIQSSDNFQGKFWRYDAVCATANKLLETIKKNPEVAFHPEFAQVFVEHLAPQLDHLDATSAKGRFLLQLLSEGKFRSEITSRCISEFDTFTTNAIDRLEAVQNSEIMVDLANLHPAFLVGGKAVGIARAVQVFSEQMVHGGRTITSETIGNWLDNIKGLDSLITSIGTVNSLDEKIRLGRQATQLISESEFPQELFDALVAQFGNAQRIVLRSSSFDEDVDIIGPAPGIYESVVDIDPRNLTSVQTALKTVVTSFFSEKAIGFREMRGLRHFPIMAIIAQEFINAPGGSIFIENGKVDLNVATNPSQINGVGNLFEKHELDLQRPSPQPQISNMLSTQQMQEVVWLAQKAEELFGPTDMEFVIDPQTARIKILQMRSLQSQAMKAKNSETIRATTTILVDDLESLPFLEGDSINLAIGGEIDLEKFQGQLFRWIIANNNKIVEITLNEEIPRTCHFANIVGCLGIKLIFAN